MPVARVERAGRLRHRGRQRHHGCDKSRRLARLPSWLAPAFFNVSFAINHNSKGEPEGSVRDIEVDLPAGLVGIPRRSSLLPPGFRGPIPRCPGNTQIGLEHATFQGIAIEGPLYNSPAAGPSATIGFSGVGFNALEDASVRTGDGYGVAVSADNVPVRELKSVSETIWGVPSDPGHDPERTCFDSNEVEVEGCSSGIAPKPFLTLPTSCSGPLERWCPSTLRRTRGR